ncbi:MAG: HD-GYP domain-containing protein [Candidatus Bathyarchaeota archaeon]|nr:HD-GYP domain-containing protein [Candidatus Bathyarchaeota archaeon]
MVKLSEIIRKSAGTKYEEKPGLISEAFEIKKSKENLAELKKTYEDMVLHLMLVMDEIKEGKTVDKRKIGSLAEIITDILRADNNMLLSLVHIFSYLGKQEDFLYAHSVNASILATNLGLAFGYGRSELINLCVSSLVHDIGYLKLSQETINKPSKLTKEEYNLVKKHTIYGLELLSRIEDIPECASEVVHQHHERVDGSGYPDGKRGDEISDYAKIVAIAEVYEAITHPRPYRREKIIPYQAVKTIVQEEKNSFAPELIKVFLNSVSPYPPGSFVLLNSGAIGRVISVNKSHALRPVVEIFFDAGGKPPETPMRIDLAKAPVVNIDKALDENDL